MRKVYVNKRGQLLLLTIGMQECVERMNQSLDKKPPEGCPFGGFLFFMTFRLLFCTYTAFLHDSVLQSGYLPAACAAAVQKI